MTKVYGATLLLATALLLADAASAQAHVFGASGAGLADGFAHPFSGLDHLLAMLAVGLWAAQLGGRALILLPLVFPAMMAVGAWAGEAGVPAPAVEAGIAASVVALGLFVAAGVRMPMLASAALVGVFALLHGHSHGAELPEAASPVAYAFGFVAATLVLHLLGALAGLSRLWRTTPFVSRAAGSAIAAAGVVLALGAV